ncbi:unnamed protein product [Arctogadus glacialis]
MTVSLICVNCVVLIREKACSWRGTPKTPKRNQEPSQGEEVRTTDPTKLGLSLSLSLPPITGRARQNTLTSTADPVKMISPQTLLLPVSVPIGYPTVEHHRPGAHNVLS